MAEGPEPIQCIRLPSAADCLAWAETGELAIGLGDTLSVPNQIHDTNGLRPEDQTAWHRIELSNSDFAPKFPIKQVCLPSQHLQMTLRQAEANPIAISWSRPLLPGGFCALAVLTARGAVGVWYPVQDQSKQINWKFSSAVQDIICDIRSKDSPHDHELLGIDVLKFCWRPCEDSDALEKVLYLSVLTRGVSNARHFRISPSSLKTELIDDMESLQDSTTCNFIPDGKHYFYKAPAAESQGFMLSDPTHLTNNTIPYNIKIEAVKLANDFLEHEGLGRSARPSEIQVWAEASWHGYHAMSISVYPVERPRYLMPSKQTSYIIFTQETPYLGGNVNGRTASRPLFPWEYDLSITAQDLSQSYRIDYLGHLLKTDINSIDVLVGLNYQLVSNLFFALVLRTQEASDVRSCLPEQVLAEQRDKIIQCLQSTFPDLCVFTQVPQATFLRWLDDTEWSDVAQRNIIRCFNRFISRKATASPLDNGKRGLEACPIMDCNQAVFWRSLQEARCSAGHSLVRCQLSYLVIPQPSLQKRCERCSNVFLDEEKLSDFFGMPYLRNLCTDKQIEDLQHGRDALSELIRAEKVCPHCGGRFNR